MGDDEEDYSRFNPKEYWAKANGEPVAGFTFLNTDRVLIDKVIDYLYKDRMLCEVVSGLGVTQGAAVRAINRIPHIRNVSLERKKSEDGRFTYRVIDFRKKKALN